MNVFHIGFILFCHRLLEVPSVAAICSKKTRFPPGLNTRQISLKQVFRFLTEQQTSVVTT